MLFDPTSAVVRDVLAGVMTPEQLALTFGAGGASPLSFDFQNGRFYSGGVRQSSIYDIAPDLERAGNATTVDATGNVVYVPQQHFQNTDSPATQTVTTITSGVDYTIKVYGSGSVVLSGAGTGTATDGSPVEITASSTSLICTVSGSPEYVSVRPTNMQDVPTALRGGGHADLLITAGSARYLARTEHHLYDGSGWTKKRLALSKAVTNDPQGGYSTPTAASATVNNLGVTDGSGFGFEGAGSCARFTGSGASAGQRLQIGSFDATNPRGAGVWLPKSSTQEYVQIMNNASVNAYVNFSLLTGAVGDIGTDWTNARIEANDRGLFWQFYVEDPGGVSAGTGFLYLVDSNTAGWAASSDTSDYIDIAHMDGITSGSAVAPLPVRCFGASQSYVADTFPIPSAQMPPYTTQISFNMAGEMSHADRALNPEVSFYSWSSSGSVGNASDNHFHARFRTDTGTGQLLIQQQLTGTRDSSDSGVDLYAPGSAVAFNIAGLHAADKVQGAAGGSAFTADTGPTSLPDLSAFECDIFPTGDLIYIKDFQVNPSTAITDTDLEEVTA
jgi:hypothetical protein